MNKYLKKILPFIFIITFCGNSLFSQDPQFSDPNSEKIYLNPAYSGIKLCPELNINYKRQNPYEFMSLSYNQYIEKIKGGIGVLILNDSQGNRAINTFNANIIYSYRINLKKRRLMNLSIQIGYIQRNINSENLIFSDMIDPISHTIIKNTNEEIYFAPIKRIDFAASYLFITNNFRTGFVINHINTLFFKGENLVFPVKYTFHFGKVFSVKTNSGKNVKIIPEIIYKNQQNFHNFIYGVNVKAGFLLTNFWIKQNIKFHTLSPVFTIGLLTQKIRISYTYDFLLSKHYTSPLSSHQISLMFNFNCDKKRKNKNTIYCNKK